jgi:hypothetical protein
MAASQRAAIPLNLISRAVAAPVNHLAVRYHMPSIVGPKAEHPSFPWIQARPSGNIPRRTTIIDL